MTAAYNELDGSTFWLSRDTINGTGFCAIEAAAILVVNPEHRLTTLNITACVAGALTFATTNFAQDFKDVVGDTLAKRHTIPVSFSQDYVRPIIMALLVCWSLIHSRLWMLSPAAAAAYITLSVYIGVRFNLMKNLESDRTTYYYFYNVSALLLLYPIRNRADAFPPLAVAYHRLLSTSLLQAGQRPSGQCSLDNI
jgi:4-hydroxybenzoate polyprenyltransferase